MGTASTSDIGEIVYNLIASGDLDKTPADQRSDFDDVFDFATALRPKITDQGRESAVTSEGANMSWSLQRKKFAAALILFLAWIAALAAMAIVSADRPARPVRLLPRLTASADGPA